MNELRILENKEFGKVRTVIIDGEPWFVGNEVAKSLGYAKPNDAIRTNLNRENTGLAGGVSDANNHIQQMVIINESGL